MEEKLTAKETRKELVDKGYDGWHIDQILKHMRKQGRLKKEEMEEKGGKDEFIELNGMLRQRYRCPFCGRGAPLDFCCVHSDVNSVDLLKDPLIAMVASYYGKFSKAGYVGWKDIPKKDRDEFNRLMDRLDERNKRKNRR